MNRYGTEGGLVAVTCRPETGRFIQFYKQIQHLILPPNSGIEYFPGFFPHENRNKAAEIMLADGANWLFLVDDDQLFEPHALLELLRDNKDIVSCNLISKKYPFLPYIFSHATKDGLGIQDYLSNQTGLIKVAACGLGGVLIRRDVLNTMPPPWFWVNELTRTDDLYFCNRARLNGYEVWVSLGVISSHMTICEVMPYFDGTKWDVKFYINGVEFYREMASPTQEQKEFIEMYKARVVE